MPYDKNYYEKNKEIYKNANRKYYDSNKEKIANKSKLKYENDPEKKREINKKYYDANKDIYFRNRERWLKLHENEIFECECGSKVKMPGKYIHFNSKKHVKFIKENECS